MARAVNVFLHSELAGVLVQDDDGYAFTYDPNYRGHSLSLSLPLSKETYRSAELHPFFRSLAPEGWLLKQHSERQRIDEKDILGVLLANGNDLIGAISLQRTNP